MKKVVFKLDLPDDKAKQKAIKTVSTLSGIDSIAMDMKAKQLTVIGTVDPINVVSKLRKFWQTNIVSVEEQAKEAEKKEGPKKEEPKKEKEQKKEEPKKEEEQKKEEPKKEPKKGKEKKEEEKKPQPQPPADPVRELVKAYKTYNPQMTSYYHVQSMEEDPNVCVIC